jgi:uncharacterized protein
VLYVALSLVALLVGPLGVVAFRTRRPLLAAIDGFVVVTIGGIVLLHVLPHALLEVGAWAFVPAVAGLLLPLLGERSGARAAGDRWLVPLALAGMVAHALLDGTALRSGEAGASLLPVAIILHRIPEGLAIWWLFRPLVGARLAAGALGLVGVATTLGFELSVRLVEIVPERFIALLQALVAGCLLHIVAHHELDERDERAGHTHLSNLPSGLGSLLGVALLTLSLFTHPVSRRIEVELGLAGTLRALALASAPALVVTLGASVVLRTFVSERIARILRPGRAWLEAGRGVLAGALYPVCSCNVFALYHRLRDSGAPARSSVALLASAPEIELAAFALTVALLGPWFALARIGAVAVCGTVAGVVVGRALPAPATVRAEALPPPEPVLTRLRKATEFALGETVEHTGPWLVLGLVVAALLEPFVDSRSLADVPALFQVPACALLGFVGYLCPTGVTPVVAILVHKGLAPGAALAFLVTSAAANARVLPPLAVLHGRNLAALYALTMLALSVCAGALVQFLAAPGTEIGLHDAAARAAGPFALVSLAALGATALATLLRRGPRYLLGQILPAHEHT